MVSTDHSKTEYERLEFLGDRILSLIVADGLYMRYQSEDEGDLTARMRFVSNDNLDQILEDLPVQFLKEIAGFRRNFSLTRPLNPDDIEAYLGSYYLKNGFEETRQYFTSVFADKIDTFNPDTDYISKLKIHCEKNKILQPEYKLICTEKGEQNKEIYQFMVTVNQKEYGPGIGDRYSRAKQQAAKISFEKITG